MKIVKVFANVLEAICIILFLMTFGFVIFQIICRFVGLTQFVWIDEIIQLCIVWEVFLGCSYLAIRNEHIVVTVVQDLLKGIPLRISEVLVQIINYLLVSAYFTAVTFGPVGLLKIAPFYSGQCVYGICLFLFPEPFFVLQQSSDLLK